MQRRGGRSGPGPGVAATLTLLATLTTCSPSPPPGFRGVDLLRVIRDGSGEHRKQHAYSELRRAGHDLESLRLGDQKLIRNRAYDLQGAAPARRHTVERGETLRDLALQNFGTTARYRALIKDNPGLGLPLTSSPDTVLPEGSVLLVAERVPGPADPLYWRFDLAGDPRERHDLATDALPLESTLLQQMISIGELNASRAVEAWSVPLDEMDPTTVQVQTRPQQESVNRSGSR